MDQEPLPSSVQSHLSSSQDLQHPNLTTAIQHTVGQHGCDGDERDEALRHQQPEPGRRGEVEATAAPGPPTVWEPVTAGDHH